MVVWGIFFNFILNFSFIPIIFNFLEWIVISQIYLVILAITFGYSYFKHMLPIWDSINEIKEKHEENKWVIPRIITNTFGTNLVLWVSAVLFIVGISMSFGTLYDESIADRDKFTQLKTTLPIVGYVLIPIISFYYSLDLRIYLKNNQIQEFKKADNGYMISIMSLIFFISLACVHVFT